MGEHYVKERFNSLGEILTKLQLHQPWIPDYLWPSFPVTEHRAKKKKNSINTGVERDVDLLICGWKRGGDNVSDSE